VSATSSPTTGTAGAALARRRRLRPGRLLLIGLGVLLPAALAVAVTISVTGGTPSSGGVADNGAATSLATVERRSLSSQTQVDGKLGYAGSYSVINHASGTITALPGIGRVVTQGGTLYEIDGSPVILLYGSTPAYRDLAQGESGADVLQLKADLVALGYATESQLSLASNGFGWRTRVAVEKLQRDLGVKRTGRLLLGSVVFLPRAARVTTVSATLGSPVAPGQPILTATSTRHLVAVKLDAAQQAEVKVGDRVTITLPDNRTTPGVVSRVGRVANASGDTPTVDVTVRLLRPRAAGHLDQAPVQVTITTASVRHALVVPVNALLALAGGGYAVEVVSPAGVHRLVPVSTGLFDDANGLVQVTGSGLRAGQRVVVPAA
jgi:peptidoglycan hydrolase-like protein with peptidoglycan-binding domain